MDVQATDEAFSLQRKNPALQNMKFHNFFFIFAHLVPDPDPESKSEYGSNYLIKSGSETLLHPTLSSP
jgi:hypothetical protein